jgi:Holliday junction resolvase RusA-like endonuclease
MKTAYQVFVKGIPKAQPRPRMATNGHVYNPDSADAWKEKIKATFIGISRRNATITDPVHLKVTFFMPVPKGMKIDSTDGRYVPHTKKPDADNLLKAVMDALTEVWVWKDDSLVYRTEVIKWYASEETGAQIIIETF